MKSFSPQDRDTSPIASAAIGAVLSGVIIAVSMRSGFLGADSVAVIPTVVLALSSLGLCYLIISAGSGVRSLLLLLLCLALLAVPTGVAPIGVVALMILAGCSLLLLRTLGFSESRKVAAAALGALLGAVVSLRHATSLFRMDYAHLLSPEAIRAGAAHPDTVFHVALAAIYSNWGKISIGLDGLEPLNYHVLSHILISGFGTSAGFSPAEAYAMAGPLLLGPLALVSLSFALLATSSDRDRSALSSVLWATVCLVLLCNFFFDSYWVSESYLLSLVLMFLVIAIFADRAGRNEPLGIIVLIIIGVLIAATSFSKISSGAVLASGIFCGLALRSRRPSPKDFGIATAFAGLPFIAVYLATFSDTAVADVMQPFAYLLSDPRRLFPPIILLSAATYLVVRRSAWEPVNIALLGMGWSSFVASAILNPVGGAGGYFANPGHWATLILLSRLIRLRNRGYWVWVPALSVLMIAGLASYFWAKALPIAQERAQEISAKGVVSGTPSSGPYGDILAALASAPAADGVFIPPDRLIDLERQTRRCWSASLTIQALTGLPLLLGASPAGSECLSPAPYYGWADYDDGSRSRDIDATGLCSHASGLGFRHIVLAEAPATAREVDCDAVQALDGITQ